MFIKFGIDEIEASRLVVVGSRLDIAMYRSYRACARVNARAHR